MSADAHRWLEYAAENLRVAELAIEGALVNASLQNAQQAVEKALKAALIAGGDPLLRIHSIRELAAANRKMGHDIRLEEDECDLLDSIYLPSKYPTDSALPDFKADEVTSRRCIVIASRVLAEVRSKIRKA